MRFISMLLILIALFACKSREEVLQEAEEEGKFVVDKRAQQLKGIGEGLKDKGKESAKALGEGVGQVIRGAAQGLDKSLKEVEVGAAKGLRGKGVKVERAQRHSEGRDDGVTVYLVFDRDFSGWLALRALTGDGNEVGRATAEVFRNRGDASFVNFMFDERTPLSTVERFSLEETEEPPKTEDGGVAAAPAPGEPSPAAPAPGEPAPAAPKPAAGPAPFGGATAGDQP